MRKFPEVTKSVQPGPHASRLRHWAARLALLAACMGSVATSSPTRLLIRSFKALPLTLKTDGAPVIRRFRVRATVQNASTKTVQLSVQANVSAYWRPDPPTSPLKPQLRAQLALTPGSENGPEEDERTDFPYSSDETWLYPSALSDGYCTLEGTGSECVWHGTLKLEVDPRGATGAIPVRWSLEARLEDPGPADFSGRLTLEEE